MSDMHKISLISTFAIDRIQSSADNEWLTKEGGPALFISNVFLEEKVPFETHSSDTASVTIVNDNRDQVGKVEQLPSKEISQSMFNEWTVVSSVLDEWHFSPSLQLPARLFIDIQGYTRIAGTFGTKHIWSDARNYDDIYCLKGTKEEIEYLPSEVVESQKSRLLVITDGSHEVKIYCQGELLTLKVNSLTNISSTVGAGDTFFAHFIAGLYKGKGVKEAAELAIRRTTEFLQKQYSNH